MEGALCCCVDAGSVTPVPCTVMNMTYVQLVAVDRLSQKLRAMSYIANFNDAFHTIHPVTVAPSLFCSAVMALQQIWC